MAAESHAASEWLQQWLPTIITGGALGLIWNDLRKFKSQITTLLFTRMGRAFTSRETFATASRQDVKLSHAGKIEALGTKMDLMDTKREHAKEGQQKQIIDILQALSAVNEIIESLSTDVTELKSDMKESLRNQKTARGGS